jgi:hypothetical protein
MKAMRLKPLTLQKVRQGLKDTFLIIQNEYGCHKSGLALPRASFGVWTNKDAKYPIQIRTSNVIFKQYRFRTRQIFTVPKKHCTP